MCSNQRDQRENSSENETANRSADRYGQNAAREMLEAWVILPESEVSKDMEILVISKSHG